MKKIAMVASEVAHYCKTGGLADVVYALSDALGKLGDEVMVVLPFYASMKEKYIPLSTKIGVYDVYMSWRKEEAHVFLYQDKHFKAYLIANDYYFQRDNLYGYNDDGERFAFFSLAAKQLFRFLNYKPDVVHVHDWQAAMIPCLFKEGPRFDDFYDGIKTVLTIHNPAFKGMIDRFFLNDFYGLRDELFDTGKVRFEGMVSTLKSGIVYSDVVTTVSPNHAAELLTPMGSQGLSGVLNLRRDDFVGILNGIDVEEWNPAKDKKIAKKYSTKNIEEGRHLNQADLLKSFNIGYYGGPVFGLVSRLTYQKGIDIVLPAIRSALSRGASFVVLGSGEHHLEQGFENLRREYPSTVGIYIGYNDDLAHKVYAGSDFFLMPSLFEPCGIGQMIAQRYGSLPLVRYTGGLRDTVCGYDGHNADAATGLGFYDYGVDALKGTIDQALDVYHDQKLYYALALNAMKLDHSWKKSAATYQKLYEKILSRP